MKLRNEKTLREGFRHLVNSNSVDNETNTPDYILAQLLVEFIKSYKKSVHDTLKWYGWHNKSIPTYLPKREAK